MFQYESLSVSSLEVIELLRCIQANLGDTVGSVPYHHSKADKGSHVKFLVFQCILELFLCCGLLSVQ